MKEKLGVPYEGFASYSRGIAAECAVLIKNDNQFLPLQKDEKVAVFGRCQIEYYRSGTGSGGAVNVAYTTNLIDSLEARNHVIVDTTLVQAYRTWLEANPFDNGGGGWAMEPWSQKEMPLTDKQVQSARAKSDKALVVIGRTAGEDKDNLAAEGSYYLTEAEEAMLAAVTSRFDQVGVILNVSNIIDMSWAEKYPITSILYAWHGGMEGGNAVVDVILGDTTPSGKLPDTIARTVADYSSTPNHGGDKQNSYQEDIYVGYRYFETFAPEKVHYPFGYGLSYTTFAITDVSAQIVRDFEAGMGGKIQLQATVTNTGTVYTGREVVQIYVEAPQGKLGKAKKVLVAFAKTKALKPGESQSLEMTVDAYTLASYDECGKSGYASAYVLEAGNYIFHIGNSVRTEQQVPFQLYIKSTYVVEQLEQVMAPTQSFERMLPGEQRADGSYMLTYEAVPTSQVDNAVRISTRLPKTWDITGNQGIKLQDVKAGKHTMEAFVAQLTKEELAIIVRGEGMSHPDVTPGTASAFGGVTKELRDMGIPLMCTADGPSGIRMESGLKATQIPIGTALAASWDISSVEALYVMTGKELERNCIDFLLGPGLNIHRHPLNGRNFEYYSEDPLLTGLMASSAVKGIAKGGACGTLKHFACNSQETYRHDIDAVVSERAIREIYLRGFEIAVKQGGAKSIMTAYNPINGIWTASNYDLNTTVLRKEWGYTGFVMTDWWAKMNDPITGGVAARNNMKAMVQSQNDVYMVIGNYGAAINEYEDDLLAAVEKGTLTIGELQRCATNICRVALETQALERDFYLFGEPQFFEAKGEGVATAVYKESVCELATPDNATVTFESAVEGIVQVDVTYKSIAKELAQSTCNIFLNDELMTTIQIATTKGELKARKLSEIKLEKGTYTLRLECFDNWLKVESVILTQV